MVEIDGHRVSLDIVKSVLPTNIEVEKGKDFVRYIPGTTVVLKNGDKFKIKNTPDQVWDLLQKDEDLDNSDSIQFKRIADSLGVIAGALTTLVNSSQQNGIKIVNS